LLVSSYTINWKEDIMKVSLAQLLKTFAASSVAVGMIGAAASPILMTGCERKKTLGDRVDDAGDAAGDAIDDAADEVNDAVDRASDG
jgi:hypothetical protein